MTGLIRPKAHSRMLLSSGHTMTVPPDFFLHPHTGRLMPIAGNVAYDPTSSALVLTTGTCTGNTSRSCATFRKFNRFGLKAHSCASCLISICHSRVCDLYSLFRTQQEVRHSPHSFHSLSNLPTLSSATVRHSTQRPQAGSEAAVGGSHAGP